MTFSIVARDPQNGMLGVAVSTAVPCVGALCTHVLLGVGAIATQSYVNVKLGTEGLKLMQLGLSPEAALKALLSEDGDPARRQWGGVDAQGRVFAYSGEECIEWFGHRPEPEKQYSVQGNMLVGQEVIDAMARAYEETASEHLAERLVRALEAGQAAGGDKRGRVSAALLVSPEPSVARQLEGTRAPQPDPGFNIRVDEHADPVPELRRIFDLVRERRRG
jgi:uncharacterized Ntn-hydrolase superfamily protein